MQRRRPRHASPFKVFYVIGGLLTALIACAAYWGLHWPGVVSYLLAVNITTVVLYGHDKRQSAAGGSRVPEQVLHTHAFVGGTPGAYVSQKLFRHKTLKGSFQKWFCGIAILQVLLIAICAYVTWRP